MSIKVTCTKGKIAVYEKTGVTTPVGDIPLVADPTGKSIVLTEGEGITVEAVNYPAIGGKFLGGSSEFVVLTDEDYDAAHWHEVDNNPIYAEDEMSYIDLATGENTENNYTKVKLIANKPYTAKIVTSNVLTLTILESGASTKPV